VFKEYKAGKLLKTDFTESTGVKISHEEKQKVHIER
jgi:hypothetical protein